MPRSGEAVDRYRSRIAVQGIGLLHHRLPASKDTAAGTAAGKDSGAGPTASKDSGTGPAAKKDSGALAAPKESSKPSTGKTKATKE